MNGHLLSAGPLGNIKRMATIADTLNDIQKIQKEFKISENDDSLVKDLMNFTTVIFFDYLSHSVLDNVRHFDFSQIPGGPKYFELFESDGLLLEYIRINNIGHFSVVWNAYEKYLRQKYLNEFGLSKFKIKDLFVDLIERLKPANRGQILEEFEVMRNTRNSLHEGGIFNIKFAPFQGLLCNKLYLFSPGDPVVPLRIMDVVKTMWSHYKELENIKVA